MAKRKNKKDSWWFWFAVGLCSVLLVAPNATVIKVLVGDIEPLELTFLRSVFISAIALPFVILSIRTFNKQNLLYSLGAGLCMAVAAISLPYALQHSTASYVLIMSLLSPILLVILSRHLMKDKVSFRAAAGVALAAAGALVVVVMPLILTGNSSMHFYPLATALMLINSIFFTLGILFSRKSNEAGLSLSANSGLMSIVVLIVSLAGMFATVGLPTKIPDLFPEMWAGLFYSGVIVIFIARVMNIASYERIGAATTSGLSYLGTIVGIIIPIIFLNEKLSIGIVAGGVLILIGVYLTEKHRAKHHKFAHPH